MLDAAAVLPFVEVPKDAGARTGRSLGVLPPVRAELTNGSCTDRTTEDGVGTELLDVPAALTGLGTSRDAVAAAAELPTELGELIERLTDPFVSERMLDVTVDAPAPVPPAMVAPVLLFTPLSLATAVTDGKLRPSCTAEALVLETSLTSSSVNRLVESVDLLPVAAFAAVSSIALDVRVDALVECIVTPFPFVGVLFLDVTRADVDGGVASTTAEVSPASVVICIELPEEGRASRSDPIATTTTTIVAATATVHSCEEDSSR